MGHIFRFPNVKLNWHVYGTFGLVMAVKASFGMTSSHVMDSFRGLLKILLGPRDRCMFDADQENIGAERRNNEFEKIEPFL